MQRSKAPLGYAVLRDGEPVRIGPWGRQRAGIYPTHSRAKKAMQQFGVPGVYEIVEVVPGEVCESKLVSRSA